MGTSFSESNFGLCQTKSILRLKIKLYIFQTSLYVGLNLNPNSRCCVWACKAGELHDGPPPRCPNAVGPNYEPQGGIRTIRENPPPGPPHERALPQGPGVRHEDEETRPQSHLPRPGRPPRPHRPQIYCQPRLRLRWAPLLGHGHGREGEPLDEPLAELHPVRVHGCELGLLRDPHVLLRE